MRLDPPACREYFFSTREKILSQDCLYLYIYIFTRSYVSSVKYNFINSHGAQIYIFVLIFSECFNENSIMFLDLPISIPISD